MMTYQITSKKRFSKKILFSKTKQILLSFIAIFVASYAFYHFGDFSFHIEMAIGDRAHMKLSLATELR